MINFIVFDLRQNRPQLLARTKNIDDHELVRRTANGDNEAYSVLLHRYHGLIYALLRKYIWDDDKALDAMQEVTLAIMKYIQTGRYNFKYRFATIVFTYCKWISLNNISKYHFVSMDDIMINLVSHKYAEPAEQETRFIENETRQELKQAINKLPKGQKEAVILSEYFKMSYVEIARVKKISDATVSHRKNEAINYLREHLGSKYRQPLCDREALGLWNPEPKEAPKDEKPMGKQKAARLRLREKRLAEQQKATA